MSLSPDAPALEVIRDHVVTAAASNYVNKIVVVCGMFLVCYEWLISLDREVPIIWAGKMSFPKILYIYVRLGSFVLLIGLVILYFPNTVSSRLLSLDIYIMADGIDKGRIVTEIEAFGGTFVCVAVRILMLRRVTALYNNSPSVVRSLVAALILYVIGQFVFVLYTFYYVGWIYGVTNEPIQGVAYQGCFYAAVAPNFWLYWLFPIVYDLTLCGLIIAKGIRSYLRGFEVSLLRVLVRDSILYYIAVEALATATLTVWSQVKGIGGRVAAALSLAIVFKSITCCRLFLSTHDAISGGQCLTTTPALTTARLTVIDMNNRRPQLDSLGYPKISMLPPEEESFSNLN